MGPKGTPFMKRKTNNNENTVMEVEGFGVTYDRFVMYKQQRLMTQKYGLKSVVESPCFGAKAAGSLYSLGYALSGCEVTLVNPEKETLYFWQEMGVQDKLKTIEDTDYNNLPFENKGFDLAWNFVTFTNLDNQQSWLNEMIRITRRYIMVISCNNFQLGYPWHRMIHFLWRFPWNHGKTYYNYIWNVKEMFRERGLRIVEYGAIDTPPWPDPVGFRDIRLHKHASPEKKAKIVWQVPFVDYLKNNTVPRWIRALSLYDVPLRKGYIKLPFSHLFYVLAEKDFLQKRTIG
jgi:hypothetical protein